MTFLVSTARLAARPGNGLFWAVGPKVLRIADEGKKCPMLNIIDEFTHKCLAIWIDRRLKSIDVIDVLSDLSILRGVPGHIRSDNGPEFVAKAVQTWITAVEAKTAYIAPGSPWENGFIVSFNTRLRAELLDGEIFYSLTEAKIVIEGWLARCEGNPVEVEVRPIAIGR